MVEKFAGIEYAGVEGAAVITAIPKDKIEELLEMKRNGIDMRREVYHLSQMRRQHKQANTTTKLIPVYDN